MEIKYQVSFKCLAAHPLLHYVQEAHPASMHRLVAKAVSMRSLAPRDWLFSFGGHSKHMYQLISGELVYTRGDTIKILLSKDDRICEPALWVSTPAWTYRGKARAQTECKLVSLDAKGFVESMAMDVPTLKTVSLYAQRYVYLLSQVPKRELTDAGLQCEHFEKEGCHAAGITQEVIRGLMHSQSTFTRFF